MRVGENPEKNAKKINKKYYHRVIVVFYISDNHEYFLNLHNVLDNCLSSLLNTINHQTTAVTLVNNSSCSNVKSVLDKYSSKIDKYVFYKENKGKVYAVLNEVRGTFESFVTISDADILFFDGWEKAVFNCFQLIPNAGVVSPMPLPYLTFHFNKSVFGINSILGNIKYSKFVQDSDIDLYTRGTNLPSLVLRKNHKYNWKERQYHYKDFVIGAYHVVSTYRIEQFRNTYDFPEKVFENSYENFFIDNLSDKLGLYRLSTRDTYAYHIGNNLDAIVHGHVITSKNHVTIKEFKEIKKYKKKNRLFIKLNKFIALLFIKLHWYSS